MVGHGGHNRGRKPPFVKQYADLGEILRARRRAYADEVRGGSYPDAEHSYTDGPLVSG